MPAFFEEVFSPFWQSGAPRALASYAFGQFFWTHSYYPHQLVEVWRPENLDQKLHTARDFNPKSGLGDLFKKQVPYSVPHLKHDEEFLVLRAKKRPVMLIQPPDGAISGLPKTTGDLKLERHLCVVAPVFSIVDEVGNSKMNAEVRDRIRLLQYPQFVMLPSGGGGPLQRDSIMRFDELQSVAINQLEHTGFSFATEVLDIVRAQAAFFLTGTGGDSFLGYRNLLAEA